MMDDEVLEKAFWMIAIMISPGARYSMNGTPPTVFTARPSAREKIARNRSVVITGAPMVWPETDTKRCTSLE